VQRPTHFNTSWDYARFEVVGHKWADLSETGYGVSLMNDCKYGYGIKDNKMTLSLLKSSKAPDTEADMGAHLFTYSLLPHGGTVVEGATIEESTALNIPLRVSKGLSALSGKHLFKISDRSVNVDAIKVAEKEDCVILRLHECRGGSHRVEVTSDFEMKGFAPCNMLEETTGEVTKGGEIAFTLKPFEIKNFKVWIKRP
jgi:alpha-mannosidase